MIETNRWNRARYTLWAPFYDRIGRRFDGCRRESLRMLDVQPGERVALVGAGTGGDLPLLREGCIAVATDLTPAMLGRARAHLRPGLHLSIMDGHELAVRSGSCDAVVLHLILAVIPDPVRCLREAARVLRPGGRAIVFDKFTRGSGPSVALRLANVFTRVLFTEVTRRFEDILSRADVPLRVVRDEPALLRGLFRILLLQKVER
jgi:ubiquinone/menaquinone biosynthesis C-methylase UbiE